MLESTPAPSRSATSWPITGQDVADALGITVPQGGGWLEQVTTAAVAFVERERPDLFTAPTATSPEGLTWTSAGAAVTLDALGSPLEVSAHLGDPGEDGTGNPSVESPEPTPVAFYPAAGLTRVSESAVMFSTAEPITHLALFTFPDLVCVATGPVPPETVVAGDLVEIPAGALILTVAPSASPATDVPADVHLGAVLHAVNLYRRRDTYAGQGNQLDDLGTLALVPAGDAQVDRLLGIGRWRPASSRLG